MLDATPVFMNDATPVGMNIAGVGRGLPAQFTTSTNSPWRHHPKITKISVAGGGAAWQVYQHLAGTRHFPTWEQARDYALGQLELTYEPGMCPNARPGMVAACNCVGTCHPRRVCVVRGY